MAESPPTLDRYLAAATRANTRRSYASALKHFEVAWGGYLPATAESVARYLADHAGTLSLNTLRQRLAALARWHAEHGFPDPTRRPIVKQVLKGIQALHPNIEKRAEPLQLAQLAQVADWLDQAIESAEARSDRAEALRLGRDRALLLLGFWRGFRGDELIRLQVEHLTLVPGQGMTCFLPRTKGDRRHTGTTFGVPALSRWCPVAATSAWITAANLTAGALFRRVDRWGRISQQPLHANSLIRLLRRLLAQAGLPSPADYSGHSLRRGFAGWANANGWDVKALMEYVGWKDVHSAMRYLGGSDPFARERIEAALASAPPVIAPPPPAPEGATVLTLALELTPRRRGARLGRARRVIEKLCLAPYQAVPLNAERTRYRLSITAADDAALEEIVAMLLDDLHRIVDNHNGHLDACLSDAHGTRRWD